MPLSRENQRGVTMANNVIRKAYRPLEFAELCGISKNLAYQIINSGQIKSIRAGSARKSILIPASAIEEFLATANNNQGGERQ